MIPIVPSYFRRFWRRALGLLALVLALHALVLAWVASDLSEAVVDVDTPSRLALVTLVAAPPRTAPPPPSPRRLPARLRAVDAGVTVAAAEAAPQVDPLVHEAPTPDPTPVVNETDHSDGDSVSGPRVSEDAAPAANVAVVPLPPTGRLVYHLTHSAYPDSVARTVVEWSIDDAAARYETRLQAALGGIALVTSKSSGRIDANGFLPERYTQRTTTRAETAVNFNWPGGRVTYSASRAEHELAAGTQDPLSVQFQVPVLAQRATTGLIAGQHLRLQVARPSRVDVVDFVVRGPEAVTTTAGQSVAAVKLEAPRNATADQGWEFWLAPDIYWLPVRIRLIDRRGAVWDNVLAALPGTPEPAPPRREEDLYRGS
ncbi:MAG: DUF3108 domain-containing protein [Burkholderiaceae bacterium]